MSEFDALFDRDEAPAVPARAPGSTPWRVLVVDDDRDILLVTELALGGLEIDGVPVEIVTASSGRDARETLRSEGGFAVALVDVVMDTPEAGLELVHWMRDEAREIDTRLLLRTGQPGSLEDDVLIARLDIHDYLLKAELTSTALRARVAGAVRAWRDIARARAEAAALRVLVAPPGAAGRPDDDDLLRRATALLSPVRGRVELGALDPTQGEGLPLGARAHLVLPPDAPASITERWAVEAFMRALGLD